MSYVVDTGHEVYGPFSSREAAEQWRVYGTSGMSQQQIGAHLSQQGMMVNALGGGRSGTVKQLIDPALHEAHSQYGGPQQGRE